VSIPEGFLLKLVLGGVLNGSSFYKHSRSWEVQTGSSRLGTESLKCCLQETSEALQSSFTLQVGLSAESYQVTCRKPPEMVTCLGESGKGLTLLRGLSHMRDELVEA